ncbi:MAG TPA: TlpA family protein disulfide reductase [Thiothrix sp.]|nr:TlpA family protein disulfide reductase [Thiothrix sp.]
MMINSPMLVTSWHRITIRLLAGVLMSVGILSLTACSSDEPASSKVATESATPVSQQAAPVVENKEEEGNKSAIAKQGDISTYVPHYGKPFIGKAANPFELSGLNDDKMALADFKGKVVVLNFWATWCPPCKKEIPDFVSVYEANKDNDFVIIGIAVDQKDLVKDFVDKFKVPYPIVYGGDDARKVAIDLGNSLGALPYSVILDKEHTVRYAEPGELSKERLEALIKPYL